MVSELGTVDAGQYPVNKVSMDRSGTKIIAASDDGTVKVIDLTSFSVTQSLAGHDAAVQCVAYSPNDAYFMSGSSDCTFKVWAP